MRSKFNSKLKFEPSILRSRSHEKVVSKKKKKVMFADETKVMPFMDIISYDLYPEEKSTKKAACNEVTINLIYRSIINKHYDKALKLLLKHPVIADINRLFDLDRTVLHLTFLYHKDLDQTLVASLIEELLRKGSSLEIQDELSNYPLSYATPELLNLLFRDELNFEDLSPELIAENYELLDHLSENWSYENFQEIQILINKAKHYSLEIKILPKSELSFFEAISYLYKIKMKEYINPTDLRDIIVRNLIEDKDELYLTEEYLDKIKDLAFQPDQLMISYISKTYMVIIHIVHSQDDVDIINFYSTDSDISIVIELALFESDSFYFPIIDIIFNNDSESLSSIDDEETINFYNQFSASNSTTPARNASEYHYDPVDPQDQFLLGDYPSVTAAIGGLAEIENHLNS